MPQAHDFGRNRPPTLRLTGVGQVKESRQIRPAQEGRYHPADFPHRSRLGKLVVHGPKLLAATGPPEHGLDNTF